MDLRGQYEKLLRYCYMKTRNRQLAEDIVQETYLRFWQSHQYEDAGKEMAYLYTIARNLCIDEFRRPDHLNIEDYLEEESLGKSEQENVVDKITVEVALEKLPEDLREIVTLRYVSEMSAVDIGKLMNISRFAVHRKLNSGLALLKKVLEGDESK